MCQFRSFCPLAGLAFVATLTLAACNAGAPASKTVPEKLASEAAPQEILSSGSVGPVEYSFSSNQLTRAEIQIEVPSSPGSRIWATKLIPVDEAAQLGSNACRYGAGGAPETCTAEREDGLAMALLERQIDEYRRELVATGAGEAQLVPSTVSGAAGFRYTTQDAAGGTVYGFYPVADRTLLLARHYTGDGSIVDPAIAAVLKSLLIPR